MKIVKNKVKLPRFLFLLLLLIIITEFFYISYIKQQKQITIEAALKSQEVIPTPIPNHVVNMDSLAAITHWQKGVVYSIKVTSEYKGVIKKIEIKEDGRIQEYSWAPFDYYLKITVEGEGGNWNDIFLNKDEIALTSFNQVNADNRREPISYTDLKVNDKIEAFLTIDITKDFKNNFISAEIIKFSQ